MKRVLMAMLIAGIMVCSGCKKLNEKAVITVNGLEITKQEVDEIVDKQMKSPFFAQMDQNSEEIKLLKLVAKDKAINQLIVKKILDEAVISRNIMVSQEDLDKYKKEMMDEIGGQESLDEVLKNNNLSENEFNSMIDNEIKRNKLIDSISPVKVSDADVKKFYNDNKTAKFTHPALVKASHILIKDKAKAEDVLKQAKAPNADFAALAKQYSEDTGSATKGGDLGFFTKDQMVKPFSDAAFSLKPDNISDLVKSEFGYHIIKVTDRKTAGVTPLSEVKNEIKRYLEDEKKVKVLQKFIDGQMAVIKVEYIDQSYNPDNIRREVQAYNDKHSVAPEPTQIPAQTEGK